jgi:hypothetical protein
MGKWGAVPENLMDRQRNAGCRISCGEDGEGSAVLSAKAWHRNCELDPFFTVC